MKTLRLSLALAIALGFAAGAASCKKEDSTQVTPVTTNPSTTNPTGSTPTTTTPTGKHIVDQRLVGTWMWTKNAGSAYFDANGVYSGAASGLATQYLINADGSGTCYDHAYSTIGVGTDLEVNISSHGFFETDTLGHLGYFPVGGTYKNSQGVSRELRPDELWDISVNKGHCTLYQKLTIQSDGTRGYFTVTATDGTVDQFNEIH